MQSPISASDFLGLVSKSGIVDKNDLQNYTQKLTSITPPLTDARSVAEMMVRDGILTNFQADLLVKGKYKNFILNGKYKLMEFLGAGGMGAVYLCEHMHMRRKVAVKILPTEQSSDPVALERFRREARAAAALRHPNIVGAYDLDQSGPIHFIVLEYVDGTSLHRLVTKFGPLSIERACHYIAQAATGLQHAHESGLVHRDIKPSNLLLDRTGVVKILDMGLARFQETSDNLTKQQDANTVLGTADYLSPEQAVDSSAVDIRSDIYSLGITFYFLLAGKPPFGDGTPQEKLIWHQTRTPKPIQELRPEVPKKLWSVIEKCMAKDPANRYQTPKELVAALTPWTSTPIPPPAETEMPAPLVRGETSGKYSRAARALTNDSSRTIVTPSSAALIKAIAPPPPRKRSTWPIVLVGILAVVMAVTGAVLMAFYLDPSGRGAAQGEIIAKTLPTGTVATATPTQAKTSPKPPPPPKPEGQLREIKPNPPTGIDRLAVSKDRKWIVTAGMDGQARVIQFDNGKEVGKFEKHGTHKLTYVAISPDNKYVTTSDESGQVRVWELQTRNEVISLAAHAKRAWISVFSPDGTKLLTAGDDNNGRIWDWKEGKMLKVLAGHPNILNSAAFFPDGTRVATACNDGIARSFSVDDGRELKKFTGHNGPISTIAVSPDNKRIATGSADKSVRLWDADSAQMQDVFTGHTGNVWFVSFSPNGKFLASCGGDKSIRIWDLATRKQHKEFQGHQGGVSAVVWVDDNRVASSSHDQTVRIWEVFAPKKK